MTEHGYGPKVDVYELFSSYVAWLHKKGTVSPPSIKTWISTARSFLETYDIDISPRKWQLKVKMPRVIRADKEALSKEDIQTILKACDSSIKLKTYVLFLAATGTRAAETLSIRLSDINFEKDPATVLIRGKYTKTRVSRTVFLTRELTEQLKAYLKYKFRTRSIGYYDKEKRKTLHKIVTPKRNNDLFIFARDDEKNPTIESLYNIFVRSFEKTLDRLGGKFAEYEDESKKRRKYTFHSFRRYCKGVISDLGYEAYSEDFIGHQTSTYYRKTMKEKIDLFRKVEPYLTYLDVSSIERHGADVQTKYDTLEEKYRELREMIEPFIDKHLKRKKRLGT